MALACEYSIEVARAYWEAARCTVTSGRSLTGADLKVIHDNCHNAIEHALKHLLQSGGFSGGELKKCGHDLHKLCLLLVRECEEDVLIGGHSYPCPPASILTMLLENKNDGSRITLGNFLEQLRGKASRYPSEVRYGDIIVTFPPKILVHAAEKVIEWVEEHKGKIRRI